MRYIDDSRQELLVSSPQFPALVLAHDSYDKAPFHWHPGLEVVYAKDCVVAVSLKERMARLAPGEAFVVPAGAMHAVRMLEDDDASSAPRALSVTINPADMASVFPGVMQAQRSIDYERCNRDGAQTLAGECDELYRRLAGNGPARYLAANAGFYALISTIFERYSSLDGLAAAGNGHDEQTVALIYRYVQTRFMEPITTTGVARHFGYSREYFSRFFKRYVGVSFREYVTELRLDVACERLRASDVPAGRIGRMAGFPNEKSFRQAFDRRFGCTPAQYRANEREPGAADWATRG